MYPLFMVVYDPILMKLAGNKDTHTLDELEFGQYLKTD